ncbi:MAG: UPF0182 family protein [Dehalococcoidia bacterium]|nr:UPF0182 family protein [Dehalococcoidia bacterium]
MQIFGDGGLPRRPQGPQNPLDFQDLNLPSWNRALKWSLAIGGVLLVFLAVNWARLLYADWLWFKNLGYEDVLLKIVTTRVELFLAAFLIFIAFALVNVYLAARLTRRAPPPLPGLTAEAYQTVRRLILWVAVGAAVLIGLALASSAATRWDLALQYASQAPFDADDPIFQKNVAFYVFTLPFLQFLRGWILGALIVVLLIAGGLYLLVYGMRGEGLRLPKGTQIHLTTLGAGIFLMLAAGYWLGRYELLYAATGAVFGMGYADATATSPARLLLTGVALVSGGLLVIGAFFSSYRLMVGAVSLWVGLAIVAGTVYPGMVQRFQVVPNELVKETPYLQHNIDFTRHAYGLDQMKKVAHPAEGAVTAETLDQNRPTVDNVRLWDEGPLRDIYNQIQIFGLYFTEFLDVTADRYVVDGKPRQVMLAPREFAAERLEPTAQTWVNQHLLYTHGYGVAMSPVTEVQPDGRPSFLIKDVPLNQSPGTPKVDRPEIYYGVKSLPFVIAKGGTAEFDYTGTQGPTKYEGLGDVTLSSFFRRLLYAWQFSDVNILISDQVQPDSVIQYRRTVSERFAAVTPFLLPDRDPYIVIANGRLFWIQDAYTVTNHYPYSTPQQGGFNYIRNSVKAVVDAYDGTITYYVFDDKDPLIQTYRSIFPTLFKPREEMPQELLEHIRYPKDFLTVQTQMLLQYHMEEPAVFYKKEQQWSLPIQSSFGGTSVLKPYYILATLPQEVAGANAEFLLIQPFTPDRRNNLVAWVAARNDPAHYGETILFEFPQGIQIDGPAQIEARIDNDAQISQQFTLWGQVGSTVSRGILLVIPVGNAILYAEPIFLKPVNLEFPELRRLILADSRKVVMQPNLELAVRALKGEIPRVAPAQPEEIGLAPPPEVPTLPSLEPGGQDLQSIIQGLEQGLSQLERTLEQLKRIVPSPTPTPTSGHTN